MKTKTKKQDGNLEIDHNYQVYRLRNLRKNQEYLAKILKRSKGAVSRALKGERGFEKLLARIQRHLDYLESQTLIKNKEHEPNVTQIVS